MVCCQCSASAAWLCSCLRKCLPCAEQSDHIGEQWDKRLSGTTMANLSSSLGRVQCVPKTAAYRTTFGNTGLQASMGDVLRAVEDKAASCLTAFAKQHVFAEIATDIGMGAKPINYSCIVTRPSNCHKLQPVMRICM